jgi:voltage-gated potassium channel
MATPVPQRAPTDRELLANRIAQRLDRPIGLLGVAALGLWLVEPLTQSRGALSFIVDTVWIIIAIAFLVEFAARVVVAPETWPFLRQHWWEVGLVALPFLRFLRVLRAGRAGRGVASAVRSSRRAGEKLRSRLTLLMIVTVVVALAAGRLLWEYGGYERSYADALHDSAMATLTGSPLGASHVFAQLLEIALATYSVVVIASVAGSLGAFFLEPRADAPVPRGPWWHPEDLQAAVKEDEWG